MKTSQKNPMKLFGAIFAGVAVVELVALLALLCMPVIRQNAEAVTVFVSVLGIQSLIFGSIGAGVLINIRKKEHLREALIANGYFKTAVVVETERVYNVRINSRHPYRVVCRIEENGVLHEYRSDLLMHDPGLLPGDSVNVYLDWQDDKRYYVDVESAAPEIIRH